VRVLAPSVSKVTDTAAVLAKIGRVTAS
jgi:hypothetical protein